MKSPIIIGLTGNARSGKDTAAKAIVEALGYKKVSFADPLKSDLIALDPYIHGQANFRLSDALKLYDNDLEKIKAVFPEWRRLCQYYGTEVRRAEDPNIWVKRLANWIQDDWSEHRTPGYVVPDLRFLNERKDIAWDFVARVVRPGIEPINDHAAEQYAEHMPVDKILKNDDTIEAFEIKTVKAVYDHLQKHLIQPQINGVPWS